MAASTDEMDAKLTRLRKEKRLKELKASVAEVTPETQEEESSFGDTALDVLTLPFRTPVALAENAMSLASGMAGYGVGSAAGLAAIGVDAATDGSGDLPSQVKEGVQSGMTYEPRTELGETITNSPYNPINMFAKAWHGVANYAGSFGDAYPDDSPLGMLGNAVEETVLHAPALLGARSVKTRGKQLDLPALKLEQSRNKVIDASRNQAQGMGLRTPAETPIKAQLSGLVKGDKAISVHNQRKATDIVKEQVNVPVSEALDFNAGGNIPILREKHYSNYADMIDEASKSVVMLEKQTPAKVSPILDAKGIPTVKTNPTKTIEVIEGHLPSTPLFKEILNTHIKEAKVLLKSAKTTNSGLGVAIRMFKEQLKKTSFEPRIMMENIKTWRSEAASLPRSAKPKAKREAAAKKALANAMEGLFDAYVAKAGKPEILAKFRESRVQLSMLNVLEQITDHGSGLINLQALRAIHKAKPKLLTGKLKQLAAFAETFEKGARNIGVSPPSYITMFDTAIAGASAMAGHVGVAATELGTRLALPQIIAGGHLQKKTPTYMPKTTTAPKLFTGTSAPTASKKDRNTP